MSSTRSSHASVKPDDVVEVGGTVTHDRELPAASFVAERPVPPIVGRMIPRSLLAHDLPIWCLIDSGCDDIIVSRDGICGREAHDSDEDWENYFQLLVEWDKQPHRVRSTSGPRQGTRMIHAMSGRAS